MYNETDTEGYINHLEQVSENRLKDILLLQDTLEAVITAYEQAGYILGKQPESITKVLTDARKVLEETR